MASCGEPRRSGSKSGLQRAGSRLLDQPSSRPGSASTCASSGSGGSRRQAPERRTCGFEEAWPTNPRPPSVSRAGRLHHSGSAPQLTPNFMPAQNITALQEVKLRRVRAKPEDNPEKVWTDGCAHMSKEEPWPAHAVPLFVFTGEDRPRPAFREEVKLTVNDKAYCNFIIRMRSGGGDRYGGGSIGLVHGPDRFEALHGTRGQLAMVTDINAEPDNSMTITVRGDLEFQILSAWAPRGFMGIQLAYVEVNQVSLQLDPLVDTCLSISGFRLFGRLARACPGLMRDLSGRGPFTIFVPSDEALLALAAGAEEPEEALASSPNLEAVLRTHICAGKLSVDEMYSGRTIRSLDGTMLTVTFGIWPRGEPAVNDVPIWQLDVFCSNGMMHGVAAVLSSRPRPSSRR